MPRIRSPNYPQLGLPEAISRVREIHEREGQNPAERDVLVRHLGYNKLHGASGAVLSAITKYGLLEKAGDKELRVSDLAMRLLYAHDEEEAAQARRDAAAKPALFADINEKWPDRPPSDENLRSYLVRRGFSPGALDQVIECYRATMDLVNESNEDYDGGITPNRENGNRPMDPAQLPPRHRERPQSLPPLESPFRVSTTGAMIEVTARLTTPEDVDKLIQALKANRVLITPVYGAFDTGGDEDQIEDGE